MLQNGAGRVYAIDVGYGQLAWTLRDDPRVVNLERTNIRDVTEEQVPDPIDFISIDVSFISLTLVLPVACRLLKDGACLVCLVKPQFEAGKGKVGKKGVVKEPEIHLEVIQKVVGFAEENGFCTVALDFSPIKGPEGNIEYLLCLQKGEGENRVTQEVMEVVVAASHRELESGEEVVMTIFIVPNLLKEHAADCTCQVANILRDCGCTALLPQELEPEFPGVSAIFGPSAELMHQCDMVLAIGGDGSIIHAAMLTLPASKPVLGINVGRFGFLAQLESSELHRLPEILSGSYQVEQRMLLKAEVTGPNRPAEQYYALNDVVISRPTLAKIVDIDISCNGKTVISYRADGVIFSTPTGSTAYALSAGGAIIDPVLDSISMTPICPHSLFDRSILFAPDKRITAQSRQVNNEAEIHVAVDGENVAVLKTEDRLVITGGDVYVPFVSLPDKDFYEILNQKLMFRG